MSSTGSERCLDPLFDRCSILSKKHCYCLRRKTEKQKNSHETAHLQGPTAEISKARSERSERSLRRIKVKEERAERAESATYNGESTERAERAESAMYKGESTERAERAERPESATYKWGKHGASGASGVCDV